MLKIYCKSCGSPSEYTLEKPKFCQGCGQPFGELTSSAKTSIQKPVRKFEKRKVEVEVEEETFIEESEERVPDLDHLDVEIQAKGPRTQTLQQLSEAEVSEYDHSLNLPKDERSSKEIFEEYQMEAGNKNPNRDATFAKSNTASSSGSPPRRSPKKRGRPKKNK